MADYTVIATGPTPPRPVPDVSGFGAFFGGMLGQNIQQRRLAKDLNPLRAALEQNIQQLIAAGVPLTPQQQMIAASVADPRAFAQLAGSPAGALELGKAFNQQVDSKPTHYREFVVRHDSELAQRYKLGLAEGDTATVKVPYDANDRELPGFEIEQFQRASEADGSMPSMFGNSLRGRSLEYVTTLTPGYVEGKLTPEQERIYYTSISELLRPEERVDPDTGLPVRRPGAIPTFVERALKLNPKGSQFLAQTLAAWQAGVQPPLDLPGAASDPANDPNTPPPVPPTTPTIPPDVAIPPQDAGKPTLWELFGSGDVTGPVPAIARGLHRLPGSLLGEFPEQTEAGTYVNGIKERLIDGLRRNPRYAEGEAERLFKAIDIKPGVFDSASSGQSRVIGFDDVLQQIENEMQEVVTGRRALVSGETRQHAMDTLQIVRNTRQILAPPRVYSLQQAQDFIRTHNPGTKFLFNEDGNWVMYEVEPR